MSPALLILLLGISFSATTLAQNTSFYKKPVDCSGTTTSRCDVSAVQSGQNSGACASGYTGACSYRCFRGAWQLQSNSCAGASCTPPWGGTIVDGGDGSCTVQVL